MKRCLLALSLVCVAVVPLPAKDLAHEASWSLSSPSHWRSLVLQWVEKAELDEVTRTKIEILWPEGEQDLASESILQRVCDTAAAVDRRAADLVAQCERPARKYLLEPQPVLNDEKLPAWMRDNLKLLYARWLARNRYYDEALVQLEGLEPDDVADPATLMFYQAAGYHRMLDKTRCLPLLEKLLEREAELPRRYRMLANLMLADLKPLKPDSLDEIARLMDEIERRLDLYQAGKKVRKQEDDVIAKLDKLIKKLEEQQQQQQQQSASGSSRSSNPAQDSAPLGGHGPGRVDKKFIGNKAGWGNLPPKEREAALQQITKDLPAHYREVIEGYFRKLANSNR